MPNTSPYNDTLSEIYDTLEPLDFRSPRMFDGVLDIEDGRNAEALRDRLHKYTGDAAFEDYADYFESGAYLEEDVPEWWYKGFSSEYDYLKTLPRTGPVVLDMSNALQSPKTLAHAGNKKLSEWYRRKGLDTASDIYRLFETDADLPF